MTARGGRASWPRGVATRVGARWSCCLARALLFSSCLSSRWCCVLGLPAFRRVVPHAAFPHHDASHQHQGKAPQPPTPTPPFHRRPLALVQCASLMIPIRTQGLAIPPTANGLKSMGTRLRICAGEGKTEGVERAHLPAGRMV